jgi:hypothetical protein
MELTVFFEALAMEANITPPLSVLYGNVFSYRVSWRRAEVIFGSSPKYRVIETV